MPNNGKQIVKAKHQHESLFFELTAQKKEDIGAQYELVSFALRQLAPVEQSQAPLDCNRITLVIDHNVCAVRFGPAGNTLMQPVGCGLGTLLVSKAVTYLKRHYPHYCVLPGKLTFEGASSHGDGYENRDRRDRLYTNAGFTMTYAGNDKSMGSYSADSAQQLKICHTPDSKAQVLSIADLANEARILEEKNQKLDIRMTLLEKRLKSMQGDLDRGFIWRVSTIVLLILIFSGLGYHLEWLV